MLQIKITNGGHVTIEKLLSNRGKQIIVVDGGHLEIGEGCFFNAGSSITCLDSIHIGNACTIANNVVIVDHDHDYRKEKGFVTSPISIGNNVWIGANCVILRGAEIGDHSVIAAGTVVRSGIYPPNSLLYCNKKIIIKKIQNNRGDEEA